MRTTAFRRAGCPGLGQSGLLRRRALVLPLPLLPSAPRRGVYGYVVGENAQGCGEHHQPTGRAPMDFSKARIGQEVNSPYELTVGDSWTTRWQSCFFQHDRLFTSVPYARELRLESKLIPFSMMLFETASMSHVDEVLEVLELGLENGVYLKPAYANDTFKKQYYVKDLRPSNTGKGTVVVLKCELSNQHGDVVFSVDKVMWYPYLAGTSAKSGTVSAAIKPNVSLVEELKSKDCKRDLLKHIMENSRSLKSSSSLAHIQKGQLILHTFNRPLGLQNSIDLNVLFRQGHPRLLNTSRYDAGKEIVMPGCLTFALATSAASRALFECLYEELVSVRFLEKVCPESPIGAVSYIVDIQDLHGLEEITCVTLGIANMDVHRDLIDVDFPEELFVSTMRTRADLRAFIKEKIPVLDGKLALYSVRKLIRQAPFNKIQNIPLL